MYSSFKGVQAYHFRKKDFELGVEGEDQDTSQYFEGNFGSITINLPKMAINWHKIGQMQIWRMDIKWP